MQDYFYMCIFMLAISSPGCHGNRGAGSEPPQSSAAAETGESELRFDVEPADTIGIKGQSSILECRASFRPTIIHRSSSSTSKQPDVYWIKDGSRLKYDSRRYRAANGSLVFNTVEHSATDRPDEGIYQCAAKLGSHGTIVSRKANLTIAYLNQTFSNQPDDVTVPAVGYVAVFYCRIGGAPLPQIRWFKDDSEIQNGDKSSDGRTGQGRTSRYVTHSIGGEGMLQISAVELSDLGRYRCEANNGLMGQAARYSRTAHLTINASLASSTTPGRGSLPQFVLQPLDRTVVEGGSVMLACGANGRDRRGSAPKITWLKDSALLDIGWTGRLSLTGQGTLIITQVQSSDSGAYICRATTTEDSVDAVAYVNVRSRPRFRERPRDVMAQTHSDAVLECDVDDETASIDWLKNGDPLVGSDYFLIDNGGRKLSILGLVPSDAGMYQCIATNDVGVVQTAARLVVIPKDNEPGAGSSSTSQPTNRSPSFRAAPEDLKALSVLATSVRLTWKPPVVNATAITGYVVYWQEDSIQRERSINTTLPVVTVNHLKPSTSYVFNVAACDGEGPWFEMAQVAVQTPNEDAYQGMPRNLDAVALSPTSLRMSWDSPPSMPLYYRLYYYNTDDMTSGENDMTLTERQVELRDLCKYCEYSLRVVAYSAAGPSTSSEEVTCRTLSDVPSAPPQNVTLEAVSTTVIVVSWEPPPDGARNGQITGYKLRYKPRGERGIGDSVTTDGSRRSFELTGLERATEYSMRLQAMTVNGTGPPTSWLTAETYAHNLDESSVPGKPTSLRVRPLTNSIVVSWTPPVVQDVMIRGYILGYGIGIPDVFRQVLDARQRYYTVKALKASSEYVVSLKAFNDAGEGEPIYETLFTREETTPDPVVPLMPPVGVDAVSSSSSSVVVSWADTPSQGGSPYVGFGDGRVYTVRYGQRSMRGRYRYVNVTSMTARIDDLRPDTEYELSVKVSRSTRHSTWSMSVFVRTREAAPSTSPRDLTPTLLDRRPNVVTLSWQPPRQTNGQITGYLIYYTIDSTRRDDDWVVETVGSDRLTTTIRELRPDTTYYFKIEARNRAGHSPVSPTVIFRTPRSDGTGGGMIETPDDQNYLLPGRKIWSTQSPYHVRSETQDGANEELSPFILWIVVSSIGGMFLVLVTIIITAIICCKRNSARGNHSSNRKCSTEMTKLESMHADVNPPDLWIHHGSAVSTEKSIDGDNAVGVGRPSSRGNRSDRSSVRHYDLTDDERYSSLQPAGHDSLLRTAPSDLASVDSQSHCSVSMPQSPYQRTLYSNVPRVNVGDIAMSSNTGRPFKGPLSSTSFKTAPPTAAAVIFTASRPPPGSPRQLPGCPPPSNFFVHEMSKFPKLESCQLLGDLDGKELSSEIAGLEGLMKDLSAISQRQYDT